MAEKAGVPIANITSLAALVHPDVAEKVLDGYWHQDGDVPKTYTINLAGRFVALAYAVGGMAEKDLARLIDLRSVLEHTAKRA